MTDVIEQPTAVATGPTFGLTKFADPLRIPPLIRPHSWWHQDEITISKTRARVRLHSQLPETEVWCYEGQYPGPTIEVRSGKRLRVDWHNDIDGTIPVVGVQQLADLDDVSAPTRTPGYRNPDGTPLPGAELIEGLAELTSWTVVHLHGACTNGGADGWAHNAVLRGSSQLCEYPNEQQSAALWYHDHAMAVTRFNVYAGLTGMYLIRDDEEDALGLPAGEREIPLVLTDRNLDTDPATGALTGDLLFKIPIITPAGPDGPTVPVPFEGPFNLVNGVVWPHLDVDARWYRFRVLNASGSRFYRLNLVDEGGTPVDGVRIIGTDGGLLPAPAPLPGGGLVLAPAERVDLLIDFSRFRGQNLVLRNDDANGTEPDVMQFRVEDRDRHDPFRLPDVVSESYVRLEHGTTVPEDHDHVFVALVPPGTAGEGHPQMWELSEVTDPAEMPAEFPTTGYLQITDPADGAVRTFWVVASMFDDTTTFFIDHDRWAVWNFINLGGPTHPMHIHLSEFQLLTRRNYPTDEGGNVVGFDVAAGGTPAPLPVPGDGERPVEEHEEGWKDTFQVEAGEWVTVAGHHTGATGEFMYHCHILDHEDEGMMRPFVVHPPEVARFHVHPGSSHGGGH